MKLEYDLGYEIVIEFYSVNPSLIHTHFKLLILHGMFPPSALEPLIVILIFSFHLP